MQYITEVKTKDDGCFSTIQVDNRRLAEFLGESLIKELTDKRCLITSVKTRKLIEADYQEIPDYRFTGILNGK